MSLAIDVDTLDAVLLPDGKWHPIKDRSFGLDAYEFTHEGQVLLGGGQVAGVPSRGARWTEPDGSVLSCPLTAVLAVRSTIKSQRRATAKKRPG